MTATLAISGWGVLSAAGTGAQEFAGTLAGAAPSRAADVTAMFEEPLPQDRAHALVGFDVRAHLGRKGTSFFDRSTALALVACGQALADTDLEVGEANTGRVGIALGTTTGSLKASSDYSRETLVNEKSYLVNPILFPNTVMNCASGQAAIWYKLKGVNATIAGGPLAALSALRYARNAISRGYADALLVGAVEEFSPHTAWLTEQLYPEAAGRVPTGEGAAVFVVEAADADRAGRRQPDAEVLALEVGEFAPPGEMPDPASGLAAVIRRALAAADVNAAAVELIVTGESGVPELDAVERDAIAATVPGAPRLLPVKHFTGEARAASGALQIAAVLAHHRADPARDGAVSVVTACSPDGSVGAAVLRGWSRGDGTGQSR
ncbi:MAG: beta-ketoacyl synthase [Catenulispora sp.]|nr:beta-ketoacyl synthase [Catenulispora sp.]